MNGFGHAGALLAALAILCAGLVAHPVAASAPVVYKFRTPQAGGGGTP